MTVQIGHKTIFVLHSQEEITECRGFGDLKGYTQPERGIDIPHVVTHIRGYLGSEPDQGDSSVFAVPDQVEVLVRKGGVIAPGGKKLDFGPAPVLEIEQIHVVLTGLRNVQSVITSHVAEVRAIVYVRGKVPDDEAIRLAEQKGIPLLSSRLSMFEACGRLFEKGLKSGSNLEGQ